MRQNSTESAETEENYLAFTEWQPRARQSADAQSHFKAASVTYTTALNTFLCL